MDDALLDRSSVRRPATTDGDQAQWFDLQVSLIQAAVVERLRQAAPAPVADDGDRDLVRRAVTLLRSCSDGERARIEKENAPLTVHEVADILEGAGVNAAGPFPPELVDAARDVLGELR